MNLGKYTKSVVAALLAGLGALQVALLDNVVTQNEWITVGAAALASLGLVWGVPNIREAVDAGAAVTPALTVVQAPVPDTSGGVESVHLTNGFE